MINDFKKHYLIQTIQFTGDIPCVAHVLNLVVQDILKTIIKDVYNDLDDQNIFNIENEDNEEEEDNLSSKSLT